MSWKQWKPGDPITINRVIWNGLESEFLQDVLERDWFGPGHYAGELEAVLRRFVGLSCAQLTNSGTSALLLAVQALLHQGRLKLGDMILHPACTFPSPCNVIVQSGLIPVFVDVEEATYNIDVIKMIEPLSRYPKIKGAIIPHLLGNSPDMDILVDVLGERLLIEDCCDTLGSLWNGKHVGTFGAAAAFSFYGSHHITTAGVGGALLTDEPELYHLVKSMTFWGKRTQSEPNGDPYHDFVNRYTYETIGYDMQLSEIQAAFGLAQMQRLRRLNEARTKQFEITNGFFEQWPEWLVLPKSHPQAKPSWFGYPLLVHERAPFDREAFARWLLEHRVEIRPLFAGNLTRQPAYKKVPFIVGSDLSQSDRNMERALFLPTWGGMTVEMTGYLFEVVAEFMKRW